LQVRNNLSAQTNLPMIVKDLKLSNSKWMRYARSYLVPPGIKANGFYGNFGHGDLGDDASFLVAQKLLECDLMPVSKRCYAFNPRILKSFLDMNICGPVTKGLK